MAARQPRATFKTMLDLRFGDDPPTTLGSLAEIFAAGVAALGGAVTGGAGGGATDAIGAATARGGCGTTIAFWHDGQLICMPAKAKSHWMFCWHCGHENLNSAITAFLWGRVTRRLGI